MLKVKVKSPYAPRQRGVDVVLYEVKQDASGRWSGVIYDDRYVKKLRTFRALPHCDGWAKEHNFLIQQEKGGSWYEALFNGERMSWKS